MEDRIIRIQNECSSEIQLAIQDFKRLLLPSLSNEALSIAKEKADEDAITVFLKFETITLGALWAKKNFSNQFKSGCVTVCLNAQGDLEHNETIYPHAPQNNVIS
jgi:uncharacterized protein